MESVDVAVIGGGPAGASAGEAAASHGADTVVLERGVPRADREGIGPDSTDAAGLIDYWLDIMGFELDEFPEDVVLRELSGSKFHSPNSELTLDTTGFDASYDGFGVAFHRARFDDWLRRRATAAGADYRVGVAVSSVETDLRSRPRHTIRMANGDDLRADYVVLADGPQRTVTNPTLDQFLPGGREMSSVMAPDAVNHVAYQEHRRMPAEVFDPEYIHFYWGMMPGHTAYPWVFPNTDRVARVGMTMPMDLDITDFDTDEWALLTAEDETIPRGSEFIERLLAQEYPEYDIDDFPLVDDCGKAGGTETYAISSTRPIESPVGAGIAVAGGAMGTTSAFHEGGDHVAVRTGRIAGRLAAQERLEQYNRAWQSAIGSEIIRNVALADVVEGWGPDDWDHAFETAFKLLVRDDLGFEPGTVLRGGLYGAKMGLSYALKQFSYRNGNYVKLRADEFAV